MAPATGAETSDQELRWAPRGDEIVFYKVDRRAAPPLISFQALNVATRQVRTIGTVQGERVSWFDVPLGGDAVFATTVPSTREAMSVQLIRLPLVGGGAETLLEIGDAAPPVVTHDGASVAFRVAERHIDAGEARLFNVRERSMRVIGGGTPVLFSPDASELLVRQAPLKGLDAEGVIVRLSDLSKRTVPVPVVLHAPVYQWGTDGPRMLSFEGEHLVATNVTDGKQTRVSAPGDELGWRTAVWLPDGLGALVSRAKCLKSESILGGCTESHSYVDLIRLDSGARRVIAQSATGAVFEVAPDGRSVALSNRRGIFLKKL